MSGHVDPSKEQFAAFAKSGVAGPVQMLNLLRFNERARYADGHGEPGLTGAEAYKVYAKASAPFFAGVGGVMAWSGKPVAGVIGPPGEAWDAGFVAEYPDLDAFVSMVRNEGYQAIVHHRQAAVADSRLYGFAKSDAHGSGGPGVFG